MSETVSSTVENTNALSELDTKLFDKPLFQAGIDPKLAIYQNDRAKSCRFLIKGHFVVMSVYNYFEENSFEPYVLIEFEVKSCESRAILDSEILLLTEKLLSCPVPLKIAYALCEDSTEEYTLFLNYRNKLSLTSEAQLDHMINFFYNFGFANKTELH